MKDIPTTSNKINDQNRKSQKQAQGKVSSLGNLHAVYGVYVKEYHQNRMTAARIINKRAAALQCFFLLLHLV